MSESEDKRLEEMAREWLTGRSVHGVTEGCTFLAGEINTSLADLSELLGQVRREERERGTVRLRYETAKFTQEEESRSVNARLLDEALLRLSEVGAERDAALSGRQHEYLLRVEAERDEARAERDELRAANNTLEHRFQSCPFCGEAGCECRAGEEKRGREKAEAALAAVLAIHREYRIYDECGHQHSEDEIGLAGVIEVDEVGLTCEVGYLYSVCYACETDEGVCREDSDEHPYPCATVRAANGQP